MIRTTVRQQHSLQQLHAAASACDLPWVSYRLPGTEQPQTIIQLEETPAAFNEACADGFVIAPFLFPRKDAFWLRNDLCLSGFETDLQEALTGTLGAQQLLRLSALHSSLKDVLTTGLPEEISPPADTPRAGYEALVAAALQTIESGSLEKVVLSRTTTLPMTGSVQPAAIFRALCDFYPTAFVSLFSLPGLGCWVSASPELLLLRRDRQYETMSLAGTRSETNKNEGWQAKEQYEQQIVTDYICQKLMESGLDVHIGQQETIQAGQVFHLRNRITAEGDANVYQIVQRLHPTPAVCGYPLQAASGFIAAHEAHDRSFYSGFLGPIAANGHADLYVNLRTARLYRHNACLYLGGGIVKGSDPAAEWFETEAKADTLLAAIRHVGLYA